jgi:putative endonuclease
MADDWVLFLSIDDLDYAQARSIELHIKKMKSKIYLQNLLHHPEMVERLKEKYEVRCSF